MNDQQLKSYHQFAVRLALKGGLVLKKYWGKLSNIQEKGFAWDLVTEADKESEEVILELIRQEYPNHGILSEEAGLYAVEGSPFTWIIDPLDGTTNYTHQYPTVSVSIALALHNDPVVGVVYNPILEEMFTAFQGGGCLLNDSGIKVSKVNSLTYSLLATGFAYDRKETEDNNYMEFCHMTSLTQGVRRQGSAALDLAYVAAGRLDGYWERGLKPWDIAAGIVLIREAGGRVTSYKGNSIDLHSGRIVASNNLIHDDLISELQKAKT
jgi:myo-inositol-1(or 4)-monophosphatase